jgi:signal recognition particle subunit SRP54
MARKLGKGKPFDLEDFREQLEQMNNMGGIAGLLEKLPGMATLPSGVADQVNNAHFGRLLAIINSMTHRERHYPALIKGSRKRRIASGSGTEVQDVNRLLKQFAQMQKVIKKTKGRRGLSEMLGQMKTGRFSGLPPVGR